MIPPAAPPAPPGPRPWWEGRPFVAAMILLAMVPFIYPPIPPITDLLGHMGRYRVELDLSSSRSLQRFFDFHWALVGNLGVDLLIIPMAKIFGLELGVKLIVMAIPALTVAGMLWVAREVHHRLPPTVMFALPFATGYPFLFGFVNFALSMAFAFLAFGLWLRLGRLEQTKLRAAIFVPLSCIVWLAHAFGWGVLGLMAFSAEAVRQHDKGRGWLRSGPRAAFHALALAPPLLMMLLWRSGAGGGITGDWFNWAKKAQWVTSALRDRWESFDLTSLAITVLIFFFAVFHRRLTLSRNLFFSFLVLSLAFVALPRVVFGSAYADMRLAPFLFAMALLAIRFKQETILPTARVLAWAGLGFVLVRTAATSLSLGIAADDQSAKLAALEQVPVGARVISFVGRRCDQSWELPRNDHLGSMVIVRRLGFSNDQWPMEGSSLLTVRHPVAGRFAYDPSQKVRPRPCAYADGWPIETSLHRFPRDQFDYVWLIDPPLFDPALVEGMTRVSNGPGSALYRIIRDGAGPPPAKRRTASASARPGAVPGRTAQPARS